MNEECERKTPGYEDGLGAEVAGKPIAQATLNEDIGCMEYFFEKNASQQKMGDKS